MKNRYLIIAALCALCAPQACSSDEEASERAYPAEWDNYNVGEIISENRASTSEGGKRYARFVADPQNYYTSLARQVLSTLYFSPSDTIKEVSELKFIVRDYDGAAGKSGHGTAVQIDISSRWLGNLTGDLSRVRHEFEGVLLHELTHAYQLEPRGIEGYAEGNEFWAYIEGCADAVRYLTGYLSDADYLPDLNRQKYLAGYSITGFFLAWLTKTKNPDFLRLFNRSTLHVIPWSFQGGVRYALGPQADIDQLWIEYQ
ncbi:MAG: basic secretory family protein, partial [Odoribacteraceae bacterium]|nr:basic secretory family protein [Odoribacteraceae bacterium]